MLKTSKMLIAFAVLGLASSAMADCYAGNVLIKNGVVSNGVCQAPLIPDPTCRYVPGGPYMNPFLFNRNCPIKF